MLKHGSQGAPRQAKAVSPLADSLCHRTAPRRGPLTGCSDHHTETRKRFHKAYPQRLVRKPRNGVESDLANAPVK